MPFHLRLVLLGAAAVCFLFHLFLIHRQMFVLNGQRFLVLFDDAMISMSYGRDLATGHGLVWFPGAPRVEGFTNPLWVFIMAFFHLLPIPDRLQGAPIAVLGSLFNLGSGFLAATMVHRLRGDRASFLGPLAAFLFVNVSASVIFWAISGMEISFATFMILAALYFAWRAIEQKRAPSVFFHATLFLLPLVRIDLAAPAVLIACVHAFLDKSNRNRLLLIGLGCVFASLVLQTAARYAYYGDPLPNTYYLKATGHSRVLVLMRGVFTFAGNLLAVGPAVALLVVAGVALMPWRAALLIMPVVVCYLGYSVYVGGDAWELDIPVNRFMTTVLPLAMIPLGVAVDFIVVKLRSALQEEVSGRTLPLANAGLVGGLSVILLWIMLASGAELTANPVKLVRTYLRQPGIGSAEAHQVMLTQQALDISRPGSKALVSMAGIPAYFGKGLTFVDALGKSDRHIAHTAGHMQRGTFLTFRPGHSKYDYEYSIIEQKPDVIFPLSFGVEQYDAYLANDYVGYQPDSQLPALYLRKGSENILWEKVERGTGATPASRGDNTDPS